MPTSREQRRLSRFGAAADAPGIGHRLRQCGAKRSGGGCDQQRSVGHRDPPLLRSAGRRAAVVRRPPCRRSVTRVRTGSRSRWSAKASPAPKRTAGLPPRYGDDPAREPRLQRGPGGGQQSGSDEAQAGGAGEDERIAIMGAMLDLGEGRRKGRLGREVRAGEAGATGWKRRSRPAPAIGGGEGIARAPADDASILGQGRDCAGGMGLASSSVSAQLVPR